MPNWGGGASGAVSGAGYGSMFGPIGTGIGAGIGGLIGLFKKKKKPKIPTQDPTAPTVNPSDLIDSTLNPQNKEMWDNYRNSIPQAKEDYNRLSSGWGNMANTGGFSESDLASIRSRAISPIRSIYSGARREVERNRALQGGYAPGQGTLMSRLAREQSSGASDASTNTEGMIAELLQHGKLAGLSGGSSLYGTTPGMTNMFGNQSLNSTGQLLQGAGLNQNQRQFMDELLFRKSQAPTGLDKGINRAGNIMNLIGQGAGAIYPWLNRGGK